MSAFVKIPRKGGRGQVGNCPIRAGLNWALVAFPSPGSSAFPRTTSARDNLETGLRSGRSTRPEVAFIIEGDLFFSLDLPHSSEIAHTQLPVTEVLVISGTVRSARVVHHLHTAEERLGRGFRCTVDC